jgi:hypothetical protein
VKRLTYTLRDLPASPGQQSLILKCLTVIDLHLGEFSRLFLNKLQVNVANLVSIMISYISKEKVEGIIKGVIGNVTFGSGGGSAYVAGGHRRRGPEGFCAGDETLLLSGRKTWF